MIRIAMAFAPLGLLLIALNALGGIVSGIWLAVIGEWRALVAGLVCLFASHFLIGILLMPNLLFAAPAAALADRGKQGAAIVLAAVSSLYTAALMATWGIAILYHFALRAGEHSLVPMLIWSSGVASGPWSFLAGKDQEAGGGEHSAVSMIFFQLGYVAAIALLLVSRSFALAAVAIVALTGVNWLMQLVSMWTQVRAEASVLASGDQDE